jgi:hypothetical protein
MSRIVLSGMVLPIVRGTLEVYNPGREDADWNLELLLDGPIPRILWSGIVPIPLLPGPSILELRHVDDPIYFEHEGVRITTCAGEEPSRLALNGEGTCVRVHGHIALSAYTVGAPEHRAPRDFPVELDAEVELVQR